MSKKTKEQSRGFTIDYYQRLNLGGGWLDSLDVKIQNWRHSISAFGGYDTADFDLIENAASIQDWVSNGLGRPIVARDETLTTMWEGFVDSITLTQGGLSVTYGPLTAIANRVYAIYSGVDTSVYPPIIGVRKKTPTINDTVSQSVWGIWPFILSMAGVTDANADRLLDMYMQEHSQPEVSSAFSFGGGDVKVTVQCKGWQHTLKYPFTDTSASGTIAISTRIKAILLAQLNSGWISTNYSRIQDNTTLVKFYEEDDRPAIEHIRGLTAMGDDSNNRWLFGIYEDRQATYAPVSTKIDYRMNLSDPRSGILDSSDASVPAWRIRPGKWLFFQDFMPGLGSVDTLKMRLDPRMLQIESVQFDIRVPTEVQFNPGTSSKYEAQSAKLGLRGTDV